VPIEPIVDIVVRKHDRLCLVIDARDGDHSCDSTAVDLVIHADGAAWNLAPELADTAPGRGIRAGNPVADASGREGVWELGSEPTGADG
jgi:hypothetical protein